MKDVTRDTETRDTETRDTEIHQDVRVKHVGYATGRRRWFYLVRNSIFYQPSQIRAQIGLDWHQMGKMWNFLRSVFSTIWLGEQIRILKVLHNMSHLEPICPTLGHKSNLYFICISLYIV